MRSRQKLFNVGFIVLNILVLFSFCNLAVFYSFFNYLNTLSIPENFQGMLIGMFSVSALIFRPLISPFLGPHNAIKGIGLGLAMVALSLILYTGADSLVSLICLRIFHGLSYVVLMSSAVTLLMVFMPPEKSGQGFGIISIMTLLPYAILPLVMESYFSSIAQPRMYACTALLILPCAFLLVPLSRRLSRPSTGKKVLNHEKLPRASLWANLKQPRICLLLLANGLVFAVYALIFFFLKTFVLELTFGDAGIFFTLSTLTMILVRLCLGSLFDAFDKALMSLFSLLVFAAGLVWLAIVGSAGQFYGVSILYGAGMGAASPLLNGLMFLISKPRYRGLNTNLMLEMVDAGFFIGPLAGGLAVAKGLGQTNILLGAAGVILLAALLMVPLINKRSLP